LTTTDPTVATTDHVFGNTGRLTDLTHGKGVATLPDYEYAFDLADATSDIAYDATGRRQRGGSLSLDLSKRGREFKRRGAK